MELPTNRFTRTALLVTIGVAAASCSGAAPAPEHGSGEFMQAVVYREYGGPEVLHLEQVERPLLKDHQVLIRMRAASANPLDWHYLRGTPYLMRLDAGLRRPKDPQLGADVAGEVVAVGRTVTRFKPGDKVFGTGPGSFAEYVRASEKRLAQMPPNLGFEQAAAVPVAALTALQGLRDKGRLQPGQKVLINGASGGVGTFAVQIAKALGAEVTGVCSTRNLDLVRSLGADHVVDYTKDDFTAGGQRYDLILDTVGNRSLSELRQAMTGHGIAVTIGGGGPRDGGLIGPLATPLKELFYSPFVSQTFTTFMAEVRADDLEFMGQLMQAGKVTPVIDRSYPLSQTAAAIGYLEEGHARGKVVIVPD
jgi:NADPH:quinone reductase-like Zn-dependent oxidoreductase